MLAAQAEHAVSACHIIPADQHRAGQQHNVQHLQVAAGHRHYTMLIALLQPAPETFDLFDDILLLSEGECCSEISCSMCPCIVLIACHIAHACMRADLGGLACTLQLL